MLYNHTLYEIAKKFSTIKADHSLNISYITSYHSCSIPDRIGKDKISITIISIVIISIVTSKK